MGKVVKVKASVRNGKRVKAHTRTVKGGSKQGGKELAVKKYSALELAHKKEWDSFSHHEDERKKAISAGDKKAINYHYKKALHHSDNMTKIATKMRNHRDKHSTYAGPKYD